MSGQRSSRASKFTESEINDLVSRLQVLLPQLSQRTNSRKFEVQEPVVKVLKETCCHIKRLQKEVEYLSERLTELVDSVDNSDIDMAILQDFLQQ